MYSAFVCIYGDPKIGKTTDLLYGFPTALFIADEGALKTAEAVCGYTPNETQAENLEDVTKIIAARKGTLDAIVIDDFSLLLDRHVRSLAKSKTMWMQIYDVLFRFRESARQSGVHVLLNAHQAAPRTDASGSRQKGGIKLPGSMSFDIQAVCHNLYRAYIDTTRKPHGLMYRCANGKDLDFINGDRYGTPDFIPGNIAEILRAGGHEIKRLSELDWQEEVVEKIAAQMLEKAKTYPEATQIANNAWPLIEEKYTKNPLFIRWTLRDALDRMAIRRARLESVRNGFI